MRRALAVTCLALAGMLALGLASAAGAAPKAKVEVGKARLATAPSGQAVLLVPVSYPIEMAGRQVRLFTELRRPDGTRIRAWGARRLANAGALRTPERRRQFVFVHRVDVGPGDTAELRAGNRLFFVAQANLNPDRDNRRERSWLDSEKQGVPLAAGISPTCATPPLRGARPGQRLVLPLPLCDRAVVWTIAERPASGSARISGGDLIYRSATKFRGTASITLAAHPAAGAGASVTPASAVAPVRITVGTTESPVVRAFGDSVTAGFGFYEHGEPMGISSLLSCKPGATTYDDACSSNSTVRSNKAIEVEYASDYGLSNNVSWAAQWANAHGVTNFKNFAVSGSEPSDWFGKGQFAATSKQIAAEDPDYVLLTMGANPLLSNMLFGIGNIGCGIWSDLFGRFRECIEEEFAEIKLHANLKTLYANLVRETDAEIFVMQYHLSIPTAALYTATQIAEMGVLVNEEIAAVAKEVNNSRITVVSPPHFDTGLDISPVYPADYKCRGRFLNSQVDGRSVQATISQAVLRGLHPFEFCSSAANSAPWVISGDTGIHPSAEGYAQMAAQVPAPD